jgi:hypothetical protein
MGLLDKTNPKATFWSVLRHALVVGTVGASLYLLATIWKDAERDHWLIGLIVWTLLCAFVGGLWEWQVRQDDDEDEGT